MDTTKMKAALAMMLVYQILWMGTILVGTSYVVFWLGYSGWWWLLAVLLMAIGSVGSSDDK